jgi:hypothetical protein
MSKITWSFAKTSEKQKVDYLNRKLTKFKTKSSHEKPRVNIQRDKKSEADTKRKSTQLFFVSSLSFSSKPLHITKLMKIGMRITGYSFFAFLRCFIIECESKSFDPVSNQLCCATIYRYDYSTLETRSE